jgi:CHAT domain-containing protein
VLSACETAVPGIELPDELIGLPGGLLQAGASGVIGSLWRVGDEATALLMRRFYRGWLEEALEPAEALRRAQRWVRDATRADHAAEIPQLFADAAERVPERLRPFWERARLHAAPVHWAAFVHVGA